MIIVDDQQRQKYREAARRATLVLEALRLAVKPGVTSVAIDQLAFELCRKYAAKPNFVGVGEPRNLYKHATCISINDTVLHGIPSKETLKTGDIVKIDFGLEYQGLNTDHCCTVVVGEFLSQNDEKLVKTAQSATQAAAHLAVAGNRTGDLGHILEKIAHQAGFSVVREYIGHGIGRTLHEEPSVPAFGEPHTGTLLKKGMVICVEAQLLAGKPGLRQMSDGWTLKTQDGAKAAMFEYMVIVGETEPEFLTPTLDWPIITT
ncbi:MAG TPA: type I methionyl aminopeptidase [Candidatus Pacebacteria bacterium]|nr:type I methionyl aminopeptidase [Candidatus Paceibacterota bacterium]